MSYPSRGLRYPALLLALVLALPVPAKEGGGDPGDAITAIYRRAAAGKGDGGGQFVWLTSRDRRAHFTRDLAELWDRAEKATPEGEQTPPGFDPVTASQDPNLKSFAVRVEEHMAARAVVRVELRHGQAPGGAQAAIRYTLRHQQGRWLIDEIASTEQKGPEAWSLRALLGEQLASHGKPVQR